MLQSFIDGAINDYTTAELAEFEAEDAAASGASDDGISSGALAGAVIGTALVAVALMTVYSERQRRQNEKSQPTTSSQPHRPSVSVTESNIGIIPGSSTVQNQRPSLTRSVSYEGALDDIGVDENAFVQMENQKVALRSIRRTNPAYVESTYFPSTGEVEEEIAGVDKQENA